MNSSEKSRSKYTISRIAMKLVHWSCILLATVKSFLLCTYVEVKLTRGQAQIDPGVDTQLSVSNPVNRH